jgi:hypothetical protein
MRRRRSGGGTEAAEAAQRRAEGPGCFHCGAITTLVLPMMALTRDLTRCLACRTGYKAGSHAWRDQPAPQPLQERELIRAGHATSPGNFQRSGSSAHHSRNTARISITFSLH